MRAAVVGTFACAILLLVASAAAQERTPARLQNLPTAEQLSDYFPPRALANALSGYVVIRCSVSPNGDSECAPIEESPEGRGFGDAAARLSQDWRFSPSIENGQAIASDYQVTVRFPNEDTEPTPILPALLIEAERGIAVTPQTGEPQVYPLAAYEAGLNGRALIACAVRSDGRFDCAVESEEPVGAGFGEAAVRIVSRRSTQELPSARPNMALRLVFEFRLHDQGEEPAEISQWARRPSRREALSHYPEEQLERGAGGQVVLACYITANRRLRDCIVAQERPADVGFGAAAVDLSSVFVLSEQAFGRPGLSVNDRIFVPIEFEVE